MTSILATLLMVCAGVILVVTGIARLWLWACGCYHYGFLPIALLQNLLAACVITRSDTIAMQSALLLGSVAVYIGEMTIVAYIYKSTIDTD